MLSHASTLPDLPRAPSSKVVSPLSVLPLNKSKSFPWSSLCVGTIYVSIHHVPTNPRWWNGGMTKSGTWSQSTWACKSLKIESFIPCFIHFGGCSQYGFRHTNTGLQRRGVWSDSSKSEVHIYLWMAEESWRWHSPCLKGDFTLNNNQLYPL